jgi:tetratricopeptide (TPR) repeat protein
LRLVFFKKQYDRTKVLAAADKARARGRVRKAVKGYLRVLEHEPEDHAVRAKVAPLLAARGRVEQAIESFDKAAHGFLDKGFAPKAIAVWKVAAETFPERVEYWERIANEEVKRGRRQDAVVALLGGRAMLRKKAQRPLAVLLLRQVLELQPGHVEVTLDLADLLRRDGIRDEARKLLAQLLVRIGQVRTLRRRVRLAQFRVEPSWRAALDWALVR